MTYPTCTLRVQRRDGAIEEIRWVQQRSDEVFHQARRILPVTLSDTDVRALLLAAAADSLTPGVWRATGADGVILQISETRLPK